MKKPHRLLGIEMRHLAAFDAVASTGSFARAAQQLGYTQSAVSLQIAALERPPARACSSAPADAGPSCRRRAGERMLRHAVRLTAQLQAAEADLTALAEGTAGTLRVGTFQSVSIRVLPNAVRRLMELQPGLEVRLQEAAHEDELLALVERGRPRLHVRARAARRPVRAHRARARPLRPADAGGLGARPARDARRRSPRSAACR